MKDLFSLSVQSVYEQDLTEYALLLNEDLEIIWLNEVAKEIFGLERNIEKFIPPSEITSWYKFLTKVRKATVKKFSISIYNKQQQLEQFTMYGMYNDYNNTYLLVLRPLEVQSSSITISNDVYSKAFALFNQLGIGMFIANKEERIFSANELAFTVADYTKNMSVRQLLAQYFNVEEIERVLFKMRSKQIFTENANNLFTGLPYQIIFYYDEYYELYVLMIKFQMRSSDENQNMASIKHIDSQVTASIVHEIRNPLAALQGFIDLIKVDNGENPQYLVYIENEIKRLDKLLTDMQNILKPKRDNKIINFNILIKDILMIMGMEARKRNVALIYNPPLEQLNVIGNEYSLTQVLINIIKNGIQAIEGEGQVTISFEQDDDDLVVVNISDNGIGIKEDMMNQIFTPYYTTKDQGTGLGLSVVKKLLEDIGGSITIQSEYGIGTEVQICLPRAR